MTIGSRVPSSVGHRRVLPVRSLVIAAVPSSVTAISSIGAAGTEVMIGFGGAGNFASVAGSAGRAIGASGSAASPQPTRSRTSAIPRI